MENLATVEMLIVPSEICQYMHYKLRTELDRTASTQADAARSSVLNKITFR
jgi:hypothetical protein